MRISLAFEERASQNKRCRFQLYIQSSTEGMTLDAEREDKQGQGQGGKVETLGILPNSSITPTDCSFHPFTRICIDLGPYAFFLLIGPATTRVKALSLYSLTGRKPCYRQ